MSNIKAYESITKTLLRIDVILVIAQWTKINYKLCSLEINCRLLGIGVIMMRVEGVWVFLQ